MFEVSNFLDSDTALRGEFAALELTFEFRSSDNASPQLVGPIRLTKRGTEGSRIVLNFLGTPTGSGKFIIKGRAFWGEGQSFYNIEKLITDPPTEIAIDKSYFVK